MNYVLEILLIVLVGGLLFGGAHLLKDRLGLLGNILDHIGGCGCNICAIRHDAKRP